MFDDAMELEGAFDELEYDEGELEYQEGEFDEGEFDSEFEGVDDEFGADLEAPLDETSEMELAAELLSVSSDAELDQFLGKLIRRARRAVRRVVPPSVLRRIVAQVKPLVRRALPKAGRAIGGYLGGPPAAAIGGRLASGAGQAFGLELEGLSPEDQEFEVARRAVRLAASAVKNAAEAPPSTPTTQVARAAVASAVRKHAPGLRAAGHSLGSQALPQPPSGRRSGRWVRRGRRIIVLGV